MPVAGTLIEGKYEILAKIKEGGMGTIYKVRHRLLDEIRVVKVMRPQITGDPELQRRFTQEAKTATRLKHPNVGAILDFALDSDGMAYIVMEFIDGVNLNELLGSSGPLGVPLTLEVAHQTLSALGFLHRKSVVHRDIAPDNLMLTRDEDGRPQIKLIDLGIAKPLDKTIELTSTGVFLGKLKYSSPEQLGGLGPGETLDGRSDLYSLGIVMYELLTGRLPFLGDTPRELFAAHLFKPAIPFSETDPGNRVPEPLRALVLKAVEKERGRRFANAEEFDRELAAVQRELAVTHDPDATQRILAKARESKELALQSVTPSAQDRLDRYFAAQGTPTGGSQPTSLPSPSASEAPTEWAETVAAPLPPEGRRRRLPPAVLLLVGAGAVIAAALVLRSRPAMQPPDPAAESRPAAADPTPAPAIAVAAPSPEAPPAPTAPAPPTEGPLAMAEPTAPPGDASRENARLRLLRAAESARSATRTARGAAERARAPELAGALYESGRRKERDAQRHLSAERFDTAAATFENATALFRQAESWSRTVPQRPAERVAANPPPRAPTPVPEPPRAAPTARPAIEPPQEKPAPPRPTEAPVRARSEEDRVRDAVGRYVEAQNSLDVDLYARVYPGLTGERRRMVESAFASLRSQTLEFDVQRVDVSGNRATVVGYERRLAVPRVGSEQRDARERMIRLEKRGESWVITELR